jgi:hypothetical protein
MVPLLHKVLELASGPEKTIDEISPIATMSLLALFRDIANKLPRSGKYWNEVTGQTLTLENSKL